MMEWLLTSGLIFELEMRPCVFAKPLIANFLSGSNTFPYLVAQPDERLPSKFQNGRFASVLLDRCRVPGSYA